MPLLIFSCQACGEEAEFLLDHGEKPEGSCSCGAETWRRGMPKRVGIHFKGGGFYRTDSRSPANGNPGNSGKPKGSPGGAKEKSGAKDKPGAGKDAT